MSECLRDSCNRRRRGQRSKSQLTASCAGAQGVAGRAADFDLSNYVQPFEERHAQALTTGTLFYYSQRSGILIACREVD